MADVLEKSPFSIRDKLRESKAEITEVLTEEQQMVEEGASIERNVWQMFEGKTGAYDLSFSDILKDFGFSSLKEWMEQRKESGRTTHVLDVMGGNGSFLRDLSRYGERGDDVNPSFDKSLVVTLADERKSWEGWIEEDRKRKVSIVAGDITTSNTWREIDKWMESEGVPSFDLVVCRGVDGVRLIPMEIYPVLLDRFYSRTSNEKGLIISQVGTKIKDEQIRNWNETLNQVSGIQSYFQPLRNTFRHPDPWSAGGGFPAIGIEKSQGAPQSVKEITRVLE